MLDAIIVGGGAAGLTAALYLGRFRRKVLVIDSGQPANRFSHAAHGFFTRDDVAPAEIIALGREQLRRYDTVEIMTGEVTDVQPLDGYFDVRLADGGVHRARKVLLATGLRDQLPPIPGLERYWGHGVFHCPYCDGWEVRDQPVGILASGEQAFHLAHLLNVLTGDLIICANGPANLDADQRAKLARHGIEVIETSIDHIEGTDKQIEAVVFADGRRLARHALFVATVTSQHSDLAQRLGCAAGETGRVTVDQFGRTSIPGVYASGDTSQAARQITFAVTQGAMAAIGINNDLIADDFQ